jgi:hypothetical protein
VDPSRRRVGDIVRSTFRGGDELHETGWRVDRKIGTEREQVIVARNQDGATCRGECDQVIVTRVGRSDLGRFGGIPLDDRSSQQHFYKFGGLVRTDVTTKLWIHECSFQLSKQLRRDDEIELSLLPGGQDASWRACGGEECRYQNIDVKDRPQWLLVPGQAARMLRFDGERLSIGV